MQDKRDAGQVGCRTGGMQNGSDAGEVGCRTGAWIQDMWDAGQGVSWKGQMQD